MQKNAPTKTTGARPGQMRITLFASMVFLTLIPIGTAVLLSLFPDEIPLVPVWFWLIWLVFSVGVTVEGPALVAGLTLLPPRKHAASYARLLAGLGVLNVASALAALFCLVSKKSLG
jgi:hypothetical protein